MVAPWPHQVEDTRSVVLHPHYALFLEPGLGKTRIVVDAAMQLFANGDIARMLVIGPAPARSIWVDPDPILGEVAKWMRPAFPYCLTEYHQRRPLYATLTDQLHVVVTNPEFIRNPDRVQELRRWAQQSGPTMLVIDESWMLKNPSAQQTKAVMKVREACERVVLLNGTPGEMKDLYAQFALMDRNIVGSRTWWAFRAKYCVMGGWQGKIITSYQNIEEFQQRTAPYAVYRKLRDTLDLGPEPVQTQVDARLTPSTWKIYREMREDLVAWLTETRNATASSAGVKAIRLAQITAGFVGGVIEEPTLFDEDGVGWDDHAPVGMHEVGSEKLTASILWLRANWDQGKLLVFTKFRPDVERAVSAYKREFPNHEVLPLYGSQPKDQRTRCKQLLAPGGDPAPCIIVANSQAGGAALNFTACHTCVFLANDYSLKTRIQAQGRLDRGGQDHRVTFCDILATGPDGQRTIDHEIVAALRRKDEVAAWTAATWVEKLQETHG